MSASKPGELASTKTAESNATSTGLRRPTGSILAPSKLSFGIVPNTLAASSNTSGASKLAFHGLKASKLESVAQAVCTSRKPSDPTSTLSPPSASAQKPSFIPLAKEQSIPTCGSTAAAAVLDSSVTASVIAKEASAKPVVEAVVAAPTTPKVEAKFVFGENLTDRVANFENVSSNGSTKVSEVINTAAVAAAPSTELSVESPEKEKTKTLTESAAEYVESRSKKVDFSDVELITGEENEVNAFQMSAKLYIFEKTTSSWLERGRGQIRLNDQRAAQHDADDNPILSSRLIMRTAGSLRVILNSKVFAGMTLEKPTDKNIRLTATDGNEGLKVFLVSGSTKDVGTMFLALSRRIESLRKSVSENDAPSEHVVLPVKRKLEDCEAVEHQEDKELQRPLEKEAKVV